MYRLILTLAILISLVVQPSNLLAEEDSSETTGESTTTFECANKDKPLNPSSEEARFLREAIAKESDAQKKKAMQDCYDLRVQLWKDSNPEDSQELQDITPEQEAYCSSSPTDPKCGTSASDVSAPSNQSTPPGTEGVIENVDNSSSIDPWAPDNDPLNAPYTDGEPPATYAPDYDNPLNTYSGPKGVGKLNEVAQNAGDLAQAPPKGFQPESVMDYSRLSKVSELTPLEWQRQGLLNDKGLLEKGHAGITQGIDTSDVDFNRLTPEDFGTSRIDPEYRNNTFADLYENKVAPDFWNNLDSAERTVAAINYLSDVTGRMTPEQASGIVGNLMKESPGLEPFQRQDGSGPGVGLAQWGLVKDGNRGGTLQDYSGKKFSGEYTLTPDQRQETGLFSNRHFEDGPGALSQLSFIDAEMNRQAPVRDRLAESVARAFVANPSMSTDEATELFMRKYERSNTSLPKNRKSNPTAYQTDLQKRQDLSKNAYSTYLQYVPAPSF